MRFPGTLSARIIIGFAVLIITFGGISLSAVLTTDNLNSTIRVIREGYLRLALDSRDLAKQQDALAGYLRDELTGETSPVRVELRLRRLRQLGRDKLLGNIENTLGELRDVPRVHARDIGRAAEEVREIRELVEQTEPLYKQLLAAPPLDKPAGSSARPQGAGGAPGSSAAVRRAAGEAGGATGLAGEASAAPGAAAPGAAPSAGEAALRRLKNLESKVNNKTQQLERRQRNDLLYTALSLEYGARKMRFLTMLWGAIALLVGVLITIWATVNLRPLRRLRDAARDPGARARAGQDRAPRRGRQDGRDDHARGAEPALFDRAQRRAPRGGTGRPVRRAWREDGRGARPLPGDPGRARPADRDHRGVSLLRAPAQAEAAGGGARPDHQEPGRLRARADVDPRRDPGGGAGRRSTAGHGGRRAGAPGAAQPPAQRRRRGRRGRDRPRAGTHAARRAAGHRRGRGRGRRPRHRGRHGGQDLRALLLDQGRRHRSGPRAHPSDRERPRRLDPGREPAGPRRRLHRVPAAGRRGAALTGVSGR